MGKAGLVRADVLLYGASVGAIALALLRLVGLQ